MQMLKGVVGVCCCSSCWYCVCRCWMVLLVCAVAVVADSVYCVKVYAVIACDFACYFWCIKSFVGIRLKALVMGYSLNLKTLMKALNKIDSITVLLTYSNSLTIFFAPASAYLSDLSVKGLVKLALYFKDHNQRKRRNKIFETYSMWAQFVPASTKRYQLIPRGESVSLSGR